MFTLMSIVQTSSKEKVITLNLLRFCNNKKAFLLIITRSLYTMHSFLWLLLYNDCCWCGTLFYSSAENIILPKGTIESPPRNKHNHNIVIIIITFIVTILFVFLFSQNLFSQTSCRKQTRKSKKNDKLKKHETRNSKSIWKLMLQLQK